MKSQKKRIKLTYIFGILPSQELPLGDIGIITYLQIDDLYELCKVNSHFKSNIRNIINLRLINEKFLIINEKNRKTLEFHDKRKKMIDSYNERLQKADDEEKEKMLHRNKDLEDVLFYKYKRDIGKARKLIDEGAIIENYDLFKYIIREIAYVDTCCNKDKRMEWEGKEVYDYDVNLLETIIIILENSLDYTEILNVYEILDCFNALWTDSWKCLISLLRICINEFCRYDELNEDHIKFYISLLKYLFHIGEYNNVNDLKFSHTFFDYSYIKNKKTISALLILSKIKFKYFFISTGRNS